MIQIPDGKLRGVCTAIDRLLATVNLSARRVASVVGKLRALVYAVPHVRLLTNLLQAHVDGISQRGWEAKWSLTADALR